MLFLMATFAEPHHIKRLGIIFVMGFNAPALTAHTTRQRPHDLTGGNRLRDYSTRHWRARILGEPVSVESRANCGGVTLPGNVPRRTGDRERCRTFPRTAPTFAAPQGGQPRVERRGTDGAPMNFDRTGHADACRSRAADSSAEGPYSKVPGFTRSALERRLSVSTVGFAPMAFSSVEITL